MDHREAIGAGFPFSGFDIDGTATGSLPGVRHWIWNRDKVPVLPVRQKPSEHEKSAVGDHDIALPENDVSDRRF
jgi:hypothetical protein